MSSVIHHFHTFPKVQFSAFGLLQSFVYLFQMSCSGDSSPADCSSRFSLASLAPLALLSSSCFFFCTYLSDIGSGIVCLLLNYNFNTLLPRDFLDGVAEFPSIGVTTPARLRRRLALSDF